MLAAYRKLIAAGVGVLLLLVNKWIGFDLSGQETAIVDGIIALLTAVGVWVVPNDTALPPPTPPAT